MFSYSLFWYVTDRSEELMSCFEKAEVMRHSGGHYVPSSKEHKDPYINFFKKMLLLKQESG